MSETTETARDDRPPVRAMGTTAIDPWLAREYARVLGIANPLYHDVNAARAAGKRDVLVPEAQLFLACRVGDEGVPPRAAVGLPEGFNSVVTGIQTEYLKPVEAGQAFTVRVRRLPATMEPTARVAEFHVIEYELTDVDGEVATRQRLTVAEFRS
jgi:N-terminal half of MaoC dehydratase